jgi:thiol:disulfide interchange protein
MRKLITLITICLLASVPALSQGIIFEETTFDEALAKARAENKLLFMDCYAEWCGPCKVMSRNVFTRKKVGDFFNANLISLKVDMEKGEGIELAKRYGIKAYPTMLLIRPDGTLQHSLVGSLDVLTLLDRVQAGMKVAPPDDSPWETVLLVALGIAVAGVASLLVSRRRKANAG